MGHLGPRWRKVMRDLSAFKLRAALVVLCLLVGLFTVGFLVDSQSVLRTAFDREYASAHPSNATLSVPDGFDQDFVQMVRRIPGIQDAQGRRSTMVRLQVGPNQWIPLNLSTWRDFRNVRIDQVNPYSGAWPPAKGEILLERSSLRLAAMPDFAAGEALTVQAADGHESTLTFAGVAYDFNRTPSPGTGVAYGYATLDTVALLGEPVEMNELRIVVAGATRKADKGCVVQVANLVKDQVENDGGTVGAILVPDPGQHPLGILLDTLEVAVGALSVLTLVGGAFLVFNTIVALLAGQVRQIGIMKAVGARGDQLLGMYLGMMLVLGILALAIAVPLAIVSGVAFARVLADQFNLDLTAAQIPARAFAIQALIGLGVPFLAALYPIWSGTRVTVREALADYGLANSQGRIANRRRLSAIRHWPFALPRPVLLSLRNTFRRRARLVLTLLPLVLSGAIFVTIVNVRASLMREVDDIFATKGYDLDISFELPYQLAKVQNLAANVPGVARVESYGRTTDAYRVRPDGSQTNALPLLGVSPASSMFRLPVIAGRWLVAQDQAAAVVNDAFLRDEPDVRLGDRVLFRINGRKTPLQIVGVVRQEMTPSEIYLNQSYYDRLLGNLGRSNNLWVATAPGAVPDELVKHLEARFEQAGVRVASITTVSGERGFIDFHFNIVIIPLGMAALLLALVGGLGLMGTMSTNVLERQRETGVMRAIGASDAGIQQIFMVEGLFIGLLSWLFGVAVAWPFTNLIDAQVGNTLLYVPLANVFSFGGVLTWLVIVVVTASLSCYWPAKSAVQTSVRQLLAYEG